MDKSELTGFIEKYLPAFRSYTSRLIANQAIAEDALQDALVKMWLHYDKATTNPRSWAYSILRNASYDLLRREKRRSHEPIFDYVHKGETKADANLVVIVDQSSHLIQEEREAAITRAMDQLNEPQYRLIFGYMNGKSYKELAKDVQSRVNVVRGRLHRAREILRKSLAELADS